MDVVITPLDIGQLIVVALTTIVLGVIGFVGKEVGAWLRAQRVGQQIANLGDTARWAVDGVDQLAKAGLIELANRKQEAVERGIAGLQAQGVTVTKATEKALDTAIEAIIKLANQERELLRDTLLPPVVVPTAAPAAAPES